MQANADVQAKRRLICKAEQESATYLQIRLFFEQAQWDDLARFVVQQFKMYTAGTISSSTPVPLPQGCHPFQHMLSCLLDHIAVDLPRYDGPCLSALVQYGVVGYVLSGMERHANNGHIQLLGLALLVLLHDEVRDANTVGYDRPNYDFGMLFSYVRDDDNGHLPTLVCGRTNAVFRAVHPAHGMRMVRVVLRAIGWHSERYQVYVWGLDLLQFIFSSTPDVQESSSQDENDDEHESGPQTQTLVSRFIRENGMSTVFQGVGTFLHAPRLYVAINAVVWSFWLRVHQKMSISAREDMVIDTVRSGGVDLIMDALYYALTQNIQHIGLQRVQQLGLVMAGPLVMDGHGDIMCQQNMGEARLEICGLLLRRKIAHVHLHKQVATMLRAMCHHNDMNAVAIAASDLLFDFMLCIKRRYHGSRTSQTQPSVMTVEFLLLLAEICTENEACHIVAGKHTALVGRCAIFICLLDILFQCYIMQAHSSHVCSVLSIMQSIATVRNDQGIRMAIHNHEGRALLSRISYNGANGRYNAQIVQMSRALFDVL